MEFRPVPNVAGEERSLARIWEYLLAGLFLARIYKRTFASPLDRSFYSEDLGKGEEEGGGR